MTSVRGSIFLFPFVLPPLRSVPEAFLVPSPLTPPLRLTPLTPHTSLLDSSPSEPQLDKLEMTAALVELSQRDMEEVGSTP